MRVPWRRVVCGLVVAVLWAPVSAAAADLPAGAYAAAAEALLAENFA